MRPSPGGCVTPPTLPSADVSYGARGDSSALSHRGWPRGDRPGSAPARSARRRWIDHARPQRAWRASWSRAHSPRACHPSSPGPVRRPARVEGAAVRPRLAAPPVPCSSPSAPRTPGPRPCPSRVRCQARHTRSCSGARPLRRVPCSAWLGRRYGLRPRTAHARAARWIDPSFVIGSADRIRSRSAARRSSLNDIA